MKLFLGMFISTTRFDIFSLNLVWSCNVSLARWISRLYKNFCFRVVIRRVFITLSIVKLCFVELCHKRRINNDFSLSLLHPKFCLAIMYFRLALVSRIYMCVYYKRSRHMPHEINLARPLETKSLVNFL